MSMGDEVGGLLARVRAARRRLVEHGPPRIRDVDGDFERISLPGGEGDLLRDLLVTDRASTVIEVGLGYASSTLAIGEALVMNGVDRAQHVVIDPFQTNVFKDAGWEAVREAGLETISRLIVEPSQTALPRLVREGFVADAAFVDGSHLFHNVFVDLYLLGQLVRPGGLVVLDDHDLPPVATAARYYTVNMRWRPVPIGSAHSGGDEPDEPAGRERLGAFRLPATPAEPSFEDFHEFGAAAAGAAGRLVVVCGLPGSGKTRHATRLAADLDAVRLSADDWTDRLDVDLWDADARDAVERVQWELAQRLLELGHTVVIEWGTWSRDERDALRQRARELGASAELRYTHAPTDELFARLAVRQQEDPPITIEQLRTWSQHFDVPSDEETARWDSFRTVGPDQRRERHVPEEPG